MKALNFQKIMNSAAVLRLVAMLGWAVIFAGSASGQMTPPGNALNFDGTVDELRVWNVTRTPTEIQNNMHNTLAGQRYEAEKPGSRHPGVAMYCGNQTLILTGKVLETLKVSRRPTLRHF